MFEESFLNIEIIKKMNQKGLSFADAKEEVAEERPRSKEILKTMIGLQVIDLHMSIELFDHLEGLMELVLSNESETLINRQLGVVTYLWKLERK